MSLAAFSIKRRVTVLMATIGVLVFGGFSLNRLKLKLLPDISYPTLTIRTELEGAPPEELEDLVARPVEESLSAISNLQQITSVSRAGLSDIIVEFHWNTPMDKALMDVREKLDTVVLPDNAERPRILRYNPETEPILKLSLTSNNLVAMHSFAEKEIKPRLETLEGVAAASIIGGDQEEILIDLDTSRLSSLGLTLTDVSSQLSRENVNLPGGMLEEGNTQFLVRTVNEFNTIEDIGSIVISRNNKADVRLKDIGSIIRTKVDRKTITHLNGNESVLIDVYKEGDANIISVTDAIRAELGKKDVERYARKNSLRAMLPDDMSIEIISDQSIFIRAAVKEVRSAGIFGCLLAIFILFLFMRDLSDTLIIGVSIPISIIATFTLMFFQHISLNLMSLGGLALGIGMLVDNSIVVLENIFRLKQDGLPADDAARIGTEKVTTAVIASTLTTIAVFFPIVFVKGIAGQIFNDLAWTIAFSLLASLVVALSLIPMIASLNSLKSDNKKNYIPIVKIWKTTFAEHADLSNTKKIITGIKALYTGGVDYLKLNSQVFLINLLKPHKQKQSIIKTTTYIIIFPLRVAFFLLAFLLMILSSFIVNITWLLVALPVALLKILWLVVLYLLSPLLKSFNYAYSKIHTGYISLLESSLKHPFRAPVSSIFLLFLVSWIVIPHLGMNLIPAMAQGEFLIDIKLPIGTPLEQTRNVTRQVEQIILKSDEISLVSAIIGSDMTIGSSFGAEQEHVATIQVLLKDKFRNHKAENLVVKRLRKSIADISGIEKLEFR